MNSGRHSRRRLAIAAVVVVIAGMFGMVALAQHLRVRSLIDALDNYGTLPNFTLVDQQSERVSRADFAGDVVIANFIFTRCPTICPTFSMKLQRIAKRLHERENIKLLSFSVDPEHDTPAVLLKFASKFGADPAQWHFLTGDQKTIVNEVAKGLALAVDESVPLANGVPDIVHSTHFVLIDGKHQIRGYYNSDRAERIDELVRDATALSQQ